MKDRKDEGLWAWRQAENNNHMIALQEGLPEAKGPAELAFFGSSAFRITSPAGVSIMIDPWRNHPAGGWDWYLYDFPKTEVDIAISTHAHFDHDGLHLVSANVILDRLVGTFAFADVTITGIADKHVSDSTHNAWNWANLTRSLTPMETLPPHNWRSFDNSLIIVETGGVRILHWGDNRPDPPEHVWEMIGPVDVALLPVDGSEHVLSYAQADAVAARLGAKIIVPHHYFIWDVLHRASTMQPPDAWVNGRPGSVWLDKGAVALDPATVAACDGVAWCFGDNVAFEKPTFADAAAHR
ncbi:Zn-dependent hydrolase [Acuticoccus sediminis]|uniref:Zn-dependent hydrolase n=1 Tax=Acuticoccus sediminis TaxID=2184697 RepID=A0A8B2NQU5_9HYPH|nr:MBL fold metallo-hydrolase [Acuticoccus sediminis]RAI02256.1 Zn-dependent hydrolase [Acuticoccus sediminis]